MHLRYPAIAAAMVLLAGCSSSQPPPEATPATSTPPAEVTPVIGAVLADPVPFPATDGRTHLAYELTLTNAQPATATLTALSVRSGDKNLLTLSGDNLKYWTRVIGTPVPTNIIGPAQTAIVWLDLIVDDPAQVPDKLIHTIDLTTDTPMPPLIPPRLTETIAPATVQTRKPVAIAAPLVGERWLDGSGCCDTTPHRLALNPINGKLWAAERFAIDYVQLRPDGRLFTGDPAKLESYPYFSADVHAVADGPVVAVLDGLPEQTPGVARTGLTLDQYGGNHIVQDIGDGNYAFYAHLKPQSLRVKAGDKLSTGQVIAALGNTGNSDAPHLHFHVMDGPDPLAANGLPFVIKSFRLDSRLTSADALDPLIAGKPAALRPGFAARDQTDVGPLGLDVMTYAAP